jgi:Ca2+-binding EF-hand superfamily protein
MFQKGSRHEDTHAIKPMKNISFQEARIIVREMIENKLPVGPAPLRRSFQFFDDDGSGSIDIDEFKHALHMKANIAFEQPMLEKLMAFYDDDKSGTINFRKFCENVMDSKVGQADCVTKCKPKGNKNVVSSDAGTSEHFLKRKIQMEKKNLRLAFRARDDTGMGIVKTDDLRELLEKYDINMTDDQFSKLIGQMDRDGDGEVTYKEFLEYFTRDLDATTGTQRPPPLSLSFQASCSAFAWKRFCDCHCF